MKEFAFGLGLHGLHYLREEAVFIARHHAFVLLGVLARGFTHQAVH